MDTSLETDDHSKYCMHSSQGKSLDSSVEINPNNFNDGGENHDLESDDHYKYFLHSSQRKSLDSLFIQIKSHYF